jgi:large subunit ribosomal protein L23
MSIFKKTKKNTEVKKNKEVVAVSDSSKKNVSKQDLTWVIKKPRITEKGAILAGENSVYTFNLHQDANKKLVSQAIQLIYKVTPIKIGISAIKTKKVRRKGGIGKKSGGKKAYVYLKKGDKIDFV